jgi:hypothetical protein
MMGTLKVLRALAPVLDETDLTTNTTCLVFETLGDGLNRVFTEELIELNPSLCGFKSKSISKGRARLNDATINDPKIKNPTQLI